MQLVRYLLQLTLSNFYRKDNLKAIKLPRKDPLLLTKAFVWSNAQDTHSCKDKLNQCKVLQDN